MVRAWYFSINAMVRGSCLDQENGSKHVSLLSQQGKTLQEENSNWSKFTAHHNTEYTPG